MADNTLTFALGGRVEIERFEQGLILFRRLVSTLSGRKPISWVVEDLQPGSATTTLRGEADDLNAVEAIVRDYENIGDALQRNQQPPYNQNVIRITDSIKALAGSVEYVRFETPNKDYTVASNGAGILEHVLVTSIGAITGRVQTLSNRGSLRFNLFDTVQDKAVACYLQPGNEDMMRETWGRRARVSGTISRETVSGRPAPVRRILDVEILEDIAPGSYRLAKGAVPWEPGDRMPEDIIRELRDA